MLHIRLRLLRKNIGYKQEEIADKLNISRSVYAHWESGTRKPDIDKLIELSKFYNVTSDYILGLSNNSIDKAYNEDNNFTSYLKDAIDIYFKHIKKD